MKRQLTTTLMAMLLVPVLVPAYSAPARAADCSAAQRADIPELDNGLVEGHTSWRMACRNEMESKLQIKACGAGGCNWQNWQTVLDTYEQGDHDEHMRRGLQCGENRYRTVLNEKVGGNDFRNVATSGTVELRGGC